MAIWRGNGGAGDANDDVTINQVTTLTQQAATSATDAAASASSAATSATNAASSASSASSSATSASSSASSASTSASNASNSASNASTSATNASNSASSASTSATNAASSATTASTAATNASSSASNAATSETNSAASATLANDWATKTSGPVAGGEYSAKYHAQNAATSASNASTSATNAASSATSAASAQTAAESARDATLAAYDSFDDRYLGTKTSDPSVDNDGNALVAGSLYFNSVDGVMKLYTGTVWTAAYVSGAGYLAASNNLSDLNDAATARTNLGLGSAATQNTSAFATAAQGTKADSALQSTDIGVSVQAYDVDTTKNDVTNAFTARQTITATDNSNAPLILTQGGTGEVLRLKNSSNATPILSLENSDTTVDGNTIYGSIQFLGNDASTNATGLQAKIEAESKGSLGGANLNFYVTGSTSRTPVILGSFKENIFAGFASGYFEVDELKTTFINSERYATGTVTMINTDTTIDVDLTAYLSGSTANTNLVRITAVGIYDNGAGTYARLHKTWEQTVYWSGTAYTIAGAALNTSYNSDATNFPAGAVNAAKVASVGSASSFVLRFTNRTTPASGSSTTFKWSAIITPI